MLCKASISFQLFSFFVSVLSDDMLDFFEAIPLQNQTDGGEKKTINLMMLFGKEESNSESNFEYLKCGGAGKQNDLENKVPQAFEIQSKSNDRIESKEKKR